MPPRLETTIATTQASVRPAETSEPQASAASVAANARSEMAHPPLRGYMVLDLTNVLAGPFACYQLAQMGASIALDLKTQGGKGVLQSLVAQADVLIENFRPGVMHRLGLDYESLLAHNPRLIYCAISGFGQDGPLREVPAYDQVIQGMAGVMAITGTPESAPLRVGFPLADTVGGLTAAMAVAAALAEPQRTTGRFIDVSMLESLLATLGWAASNHFMAGVDAKPMGNDNISASPSGTFRTGDGLLNIAANKQAQFEALAKAIGRAELIADPRFAARQARLANRAALTAEIESALAARSAEQWWQALTAADVPAGPVYSVPEALALPLIAERGLVAHYPDGAGTGRDVRVLRSAVKIDGGVPATGTPPPTLGQHTLDILRELGLDDAEIDSLKQQGAI